MAVHPSQAKWQPSRLPGSQCSEESPVGADLSAEMDNNLNACPLPADEAAIYQEIDTGTERRCLTGEKDGGANHLVDRGDPPQRCIGSKCFELLGHFRTLVHWREGIPRTDAIHPNPAVTPFHRETFREMDHRSFRAIVMRLG